MKDNPTLVSQLNEFESIPYRALLARDPNRFDRWVSRELHVKFDSDGKVLHVRGNNQSNTYNRDWKPGSWHHLTLVKDGHVKVGPNNSYITELKALFAELNASKLTFDSGKPVALEWQQRLKEKVGKVLATLTGTGA